MHKLSDWYLNLKFRRKILLILLATSLLPVIVLGIFCYTQTRNLLIGREYEVLNESLRQGTQALNSQLSAYMNALNNVLQDDSIQTVLNTDYGADNASMYLAYRDVIDPSFQRIRSLNRNILELTIYTDNRIYPHDNILCPLETATTELWYTEELFESYSPRWSTTKPDSLELVCLLYTPARVHTSLVCLSAQLSPTFANLTTLFDDSYGITVVDADGNSIFTHTSFSGTELVLPLPAEEILNLDGKEQLSDDYVFATSEIPISGWTAILYRPIRIVSAAATQITLLVVIIVILCIAAVAAVSAILSRLVVRPLEELERNIERVEQGDLSITVMKASGDEIGHVVQSFGNMVTRLQAMIDEVYKSKIAQQEYEMKALQAQINPHFLYNSLSLINWRAMMTGQEYISRMAQLLSTFYRTTLNKGRSTTLVRNELDNVRSYTEIQRIMHSERFSVSYDFDEEVMDCVILNLLLQPLVENAIVHGMDNREDTELGRLLLTARQEDGDILFTVADNGCGIPQEILNCILTSESSGYGVQNVHHRVRLYYGEGYGLSYESREREGTCVTLRIPAVRSNPAVPTIQPPEQQK